MYFVSRSISKITLFQINDYFSIIPFLYARTSHCVILFVEEYYVGGHTMNTNKDFKVAHTYWKRAENNRTQVRTFSEMARSIFYVVPLCFVLVAWAGKILSQPKNMYRVVRSYL